METAATENVDMISFFTFLGVGLALAVAALIARVKSGDRYEIRTIHLVLLLLPVFLWLFITGKITKLNIAGVEVEAAAAAFVEAARKPISFTPQTRESLVDDVISTVQRAEKLGVERIPSLITRKTEALEFQLGHGGYWGPAIAKYFEVLSSAGFLKYVLIYRNRERTLFGAYDARSLLVALQNQGESGYASLAAQLNDGDQAALDALRTLPGFVSAADAVTPESNKRMALETMERLNRDFLPVVDGEGRFIGIVDRSGVTASLIIAVTRAMEELTPRKEQ